MSGPVVDYAVDDFHIAADVIGDLFLRHPERLQELLFQYFSRGRRLAQHSHSIDPLVVIGDSHHHGATGSPPKHDAPLIVDPDAEVSVHPAFQSLEPIAGRGA